MLPGSGKIWDSCIGERKIGQDLRVWSDDFRDGGKPKGPLRRTRRARLGEKKSTGEEDFGSVVGEMLNSVVDVDEVVKALLEYRSELVGDLVQLSREDE